MQSDVTNWAPLVEYRRHGLAECVIHGAVAWVHGTENMYNWGGDPVVYGRSTMKPFHARVFLKELSTLKGEQQAVAVSSHNGDAAHVQAARSLLQGRDLAALQTPAALPLMQTHKFLGTPTRVVEKPEVWCHTCSGNHAAILLGSALRGWPTEGYNTLTHPFHAAYIKELQSFLGSRWQPFTSAKDNCGLPTISLSIHELAALYAGLVQERERTWIWPAMTKFPEFVGGVNRLDTTIMQGAAGKVIAKEGADGLLALGVAHPAYPKGLGLVVKIAHGSDHWAMWHVVHALLTPLGFAFAKAQPLVRQRAVVNAEIVPSSLRAHFVEDASWDLSVDDAW